MSLQGAPARVPVRDRALGVRQATLARILAGLDDFSRGEVLLDGAHDPRPRSRSRHGVQGYTLFPCSPF